MSDKNKDIYNDVPPREEVRAFVGLDKIGLDFDFQPKWNIPEKIVITCAITGGPIKKARNPNQPYTTKEIRDSAVQCIEAGATNVHVHIRGDNGEGSLEDVHEIIRRMHDVIDPIKAKYGNKVIIDTCECIQRRFEDEKILIDEGLAEITPLNPSFTSQKMLQAEAYYLQEKGVKPEMAIGSDGDLSRVKSWLIDSGILSKPLYWLLLPAYFIGGTPLPNEFAMAENLIWQVRHIREIDPESRIMVCMAGRPSSYLTTMAILLGLHVRIGMEDTYYRWPHKNDLITSNVEIYKSTLSIANALGRSQTTANEYRALVGLPER